MDIEGRIEFYSRKLAPHDKVIYRDAKTRDDYRAEMHLLVWKIQKEHPEAVGERYLSRSLKNYVLTQMRYRARREAWEQLFAFDPDWEWWGPSYDDTNRHEASLLLARLQESMSARSWRVLAALGGAETLTAARNDFDPRMAISTFHWVTRRAREAARAEV